MKQIGIFITTKCIKKFLFLLDTVTNDVMVYDFYQIQAELCKITSNVFAPPTDLRFYKVVRHAREAVLIGSIQTGNRKTHTNGKSVGPNKVVFSTKCFLLLCMFYMKVLYTC